MSEINEDFCSRINATDLRGALPTNKNGTKFRWRDPSQLKGIVFHQSLSWGNIEQTHKYHTGPNHMAANGLERISYTIGIRRNGEVCFLNNLETKTWSQGITKRYGDENAEFLAVLFEGMFKWGNETEYLGQKLGEPSEQQLQSALDIWNNTASYFNWDTQDLYGHFDFGKPACPGNTLESFILGIRNQYDFSSIKDKERFLKSFGFESIRSFQETVNISGYGKKIGVDGAFGPQTTSAAHYWVQHHSPQ